MAFTNQDDEDVEEDFLETDRQIPGQNYCCMSFVSPTKILKKKQLFLFSEFLKDLVKVKTDESTEQFRERTDLMENIKNGKLDYESLNELYDGFVYRDGEVLEKFFYEENEFQTTVQGVKVRGVYDTLKEAEVRAKVLRKRDKNFHVYVGQVGYWLPWDPDPDNITKQEYQESQLNTLVKKYNENKEGRDDLYEQLKNEKLEKSRQKAKDDKKKKKEDRESNQLTLIEEETTSDLNVTDVEESKQVDEKISKFRELLNKKDCKYSGLMEAKDSDPWMKRKEDEKKAKELELEQQHASVEEVEEVEEEQFIELVKEVVEPTVVD